MIIEDYYFEKNEIDWSKKRYLVLIIYDISDDKLRAKFVQYLERYGYRVQKSAFEAKVTESQYKKLVSNIEYYTRKGDSIRVYKLNGYQEVKTWGSDFRLNEEEVVII